MFWKKKKPVEVLLHRAGATVYQDGRYLVADVRMSTRSKKGRDALKDVADVLLAASIEKDLFTGTENTKE